MQLANDAFHSIVAHSPTEACAPSSNDQHQEALASAPAAVTKRTYHHNNNGKFAKKPKVKVKQGNKDGSRDQVQIQQQIAREAVVKIDRNLRHTQGRQDTIESLREKLNAQSEIMMELENAVVEYDETLCEIQRQLATANKCRQGDKKGQDVKVEKLVDKKLKHHQQRSESMKEKLDKEKLFRQKKEEAIDKLEKEHKAATKKIKQESEEKLKQQKQTLEDEAIANMKLQGEGYVEMIAKLETEVEATKEVAKQKMKDKVTQLTNEGRIIQKFGDTNTSHPCHKVCSGMKMSE